MVVTLQIPTASASGGGGSGGGSGVNNTTSPQEYPYVLPASLFPTPSNLSSVSPIAGVDAIPLPGASSSFAVINASSSGSSSTLWSDVASYSPVDAKLIATNGTCGPGCGDLPINWSNRSEVASFNGSITAERIAAVGSMLVVAATSSATTDLYSWSNTRREWLPFGPAVQGQLVSLSAGPEELAVATLGSGSLDITTISAGGSSLGNATVHPSGTGSSGVIDACVSLVPSGPSYLEVAVLSAKGSNQIQLSSSTDGVHFSTPSKIGAFANTTINPTLSTIGQTLLSSSGGIPGQLALTSLGSELFLLYTTNVSGQTVPATESSGNSGITWEGPFLSGAINGSVVNPSVTVGPAGLVYATWTDPDYGSGAIEEAVYFPDGIPQLSPQTLPAGGTNGTSPVGWATIAVDAFERPLVLWPAAPPNESGAIEYTGGFLAANVSLNLTETIANTTLGAWDFASGSSSNAGYLSLIGNITRNVQRVDANLSSGNICQAQNLTAISLYQNLSHVPLTVQSGSGTVCAAHLIPSSLTSPLLSSTGLYEPNTYLAIYGDWALEAEGVPVSVSPLASLSEFTPYSAMSLPAALPAPVPGSTSIDSQTETVTVSPTPYSPTGYELSTSASLPYWTKTVMSVSCDLPQPSPKISATYTTAVAQTWVNLSIDGGPSHSYSGSTSYPSVWVDNLTPYQTYYWNANFAARTTETEQIYNPCTHSTTTLPVSPVSYGPASIPSIALNGAFSTALSISIGPQFVTAAFNQTHSGATVVVQFNNTLPSTVQGALSGAPNSQSWNSTALAIGESHTFSQWVPVNQTYSVSLASVSRAGAAVPAGSPSFSFGGPGVSSPEQASALCQFTLTTAVPTVSNALGGPYTSLNATTANVTWVSTADALGFFTYFEVGSPVNWTISGIVPIRWNATTWVYSIEVHGLEPLVAYNGTFGVSVNHGCLVEEDQVVTLPFRTSSDPAFDTDPSLPYAWANSLPYDSISQSGGGIVVYWDLPTNASLGAGVHTLLGGYVRLWNLSAALVLPFVPGQVSQNVANGTAAAAFNPPLALNDRYDFRVVANYTYMKFLGARHNPPYSNSTESAAAANHFTYESDTSRDGLNDIEKQNGWVVPLAPTSIRDGTPVPGCNPPKNLTERAACAADPSAVVSANPLYYATNGLVNDFVEKEFGLDPNTLDTAGSYMLDTWNLTFDLGTGSPALPSAFHYFYENTSYDFSKNCQVFTPGAASCSFTPHSLGANNLTCWTLGAACSRGWAGDSVPWAAETLWSKTSLKELEWAMASESVPWLRAVTGHYGADRTITVWGKLSWGANPLVRSTSGDGVADGNQISPLGPVVAQFNVSSWNFYDAPELGDGVAPVLVISTTQTTPYWKAPSNYTGYGPTVNTTAAGTVYAGPYVVSIPLVSPSQQIFWRIDLNISTLQSSKSGSTYSVTQLAGNANPWQSLDLLRGPQPLRVSLAVNNSSLSLNGVVGSIQLNVSVHFASAKPNTLLVAPANNTTLSSAPWGLKRYIAEPDFDLLIMNLTGTSTPTVVSGIPLAGGGPAYSLTLQPGLNNLLVPRSIFLGSPLGQALLNNTNESAAGTFVPGDWSARTEVSSNNSPGSPSFIWIFSSGTFDQMNSSNSAGFGGMPGNPTLEAGAQSLQVQAVVWVNVSSQGYRGLSSATAEIQDLVNGLTFNSSGGLVNNVDNITSEVSNLGLPEAVLGALAALAMPNNGSFAPPIYTPPPPDPSEWGVFAQWVWNTVTGVAKAVINGVTTFISVVWSATIAAIAYIGAALKSTGELADQGIALLASQAESALKSVASAMLWALEQLLQALVQAAQAAISLAWRGAASLATGYAHNIDASFISCESAIYGAANASGSNNNLNLAGENACIGMAGAILGIGGVMGTIYQTIDSIMTTLQPVLQFFSLSWLASKIEQAIGSTAPLGGALRYVEGVLNSAASAAASGLGSALNYSGASQNITNPSAVPGWFPSASVGIPFIASGAGIGIPAAPTWFSAIWSLFNSPGRVAVVISMGFATGLYLSDLIGSILGFGLKGIGAAVPFVLVEMPAIILTVVGWILLLVGGLVGYLASIVFDVISVGWTIGEILRGEVTNQFEAIIAGADIGADVIDLGVSTFSLGPLL